MNQFKRMMVWLRRIGHCRGFGIQSPTDYRFVRSVVNERCPYYAYESLGRDDDWLKRKLGRLYFRIINDRQPAVVVDWLGVDEYLKAGCRTAQIVKSTDRIELAFLPIQMDYQGLFNLCDDSSVVVFQDIYRNKPLWHCIEYDPRTSVTFDLYYCGVVFFDKKRAKQNYIVNF